MAKRSVTAILKLQWLGLLGFVLIVYAATACEIVTKTGGMSTLCAPPRSTQVQEIEGL